MNIEQAKAIDLSVVLKQLGFHPVEARAYDLWYLSPFRDETTPSFHLHAVKNIWHDFGKADDPTGGTTLDFACAWLQHNGNDHTVIDALRWLENMQPKSKIVVSLKEDFKSEDGPALELRKVLPVQSPLFIDYLDSRGIPLSYAKKYLKEVHVCNRNTGKLFQALGLRNENGGYDLRNQLFKGTLAPKGISFIRGKTVLPQDIHVFEGMMDFLSALVYLNAQKFGGDVIVLNSTSCLSQSLPYIKNYSYKNLFTWFDNNAAGLRATEALKSFAAKEGLSFKAMNDIYAGFDDVNAWHKKKLEL